ncbi:MAG: tetratricopeptide repeat protein [Verrucomicrobiota bacterium]
MSEAIEKLPRFDPEHPPVAVSTETAQSLDDLAGAGRFVEAYQLINEQAPALYWNDLDARLDASYVYARLGADRLSDLIDLWTYRCHRENARTIVRMAHYYQSRRGPFYAHQLLSEAKLDQYDEIGQGRILRTQGWMCLEFDDTTRAETQIEQAYALDGNEHRHWHARSTVAYKKEKYEQAREEAGKSLQANPNYLPARFILAGALDRLEEMDEMERVLGDGLSSSQDRQLAIQLLRYFKELRRFDEALEIIRLIDQWSPIRQKDLVEWVHGEYADIHYDLGQYELAQEHAGKGNVTYYQKFAERLGSMTESPKRCRIDVPSVRQLRRTCGPATLTALARYWGRSVEQSDIIEDIWHDGTFDWRERRWAEEQGFVVREFRADWPSTQRLIDAGYPFAIMTAGADFSHLQAIIGYDAVRECVEVREPGAFHHIDYIQDKFFSSNAWVGPRGLVFAPEEDAQALIEMDLPDQTMYDQCYEMNRALEDHDRDRAARLLEDIERDSPESLLFHSASRRLASYDADNVRALDSVRALRKLFPEATRLQLSEIGYMQTQSSWSDRLELLRELTQGDKVHPVVRLELARHLMDDVRCSDEAEKVLWRCQREHPESAAILHALGDLKWNRGDRESAFDAYRFAFTLDYLNEGRARAFFQAARFFQQHLIALALLQERFERFGGSSGDPAITLADMLRLLDRDKESLEVFDDALKRRPNDADLLAAYASRCIDWNRLTLASELLDDAKGNIHELSWLELSARLATARGEHEQALALYGKAVALSEQRVDLQSAYVAVVHRLQGKQQVIEYLESLADRFPYHNEINEMYITWLRDVYFDRADAACRKLLERHPNNHWARRELAISLENQGQLAEAIDVAVEAKNNDRHAAASYTVLGNLYEKDQQFEEAANCYRQAIQLEVDNGFAINHLCDMALNEAQERDTLAFIWNEIETQTLFGDGLMEFRRHASGVWDSDDLLARLKSALNARSDLWHCHSALVIQYLDMGQAGEALAAAEACCEQFPLVPGSFANLSRVAKHQQDLSRQIEALEQALELNPHWVDVVEVLADCYSLADRGEDEKELIERTLRRLPKSYTMHGYLAAWHARRGNTRAAIESLEIALSIEPDYPFAWARLDEWGSHEECTRKARTLTEERPGEARIWQLLANTLQLEEEQEERLAALTKASELEPWNIELLDEISMLLVQMDRHDEALAAVTPESRRDAMPFQLLGRQAWILWEQNKQDEAIAMMAEIIEANPSYWWGCSRRFEWLIDSKKNEDAHDAALSMTERWPQVYVSWGYLGQALHRLGKDDEAQAALKKALSLEPDYPWGWDMLESLAKREELETLALEMAERCPGQSRPWMIYARAMDEQNRINDCLEAIDQALERDARLIDAIDYKIILLTRAGRFDEAREACLPAAFEDDVPFNLLGRRAWVLAEEGKIAEAVEELKPIWSEHPDYYWGGERLLEWQRALENFGELAQVANEFKEQFPTDPVGYGYSAIAALGKQNFGEAKRELRDALEVDEEYFFAANRLFFLYFEDNELSLAEEVANRYAVTLGDSRVAVFNALLAAARNRWKNLKPFLKDLATLEPMDVAHLRYLWDYLGRSSKNSQLLREFTQQANRGEISAPALQFLVEARISRKKFSLDGYISQLSPELQGIAVDTYFYQASEGLLPFSDIKRAIRRHRKLIVQNSVAWGNVASCFYRHRKYNDVIEWMGDWRTREGVELWMLNNLLFAYISKADWPAADEVARAQIDNRSIQHGSDHPFGYLAFRLAQGGHTEKAEAFLRCVASMEADSMSMLTTGGTQIFLELHADLPSDELRRRIRTRLKDLFEKASSGKWSRPDALHLFRVILATIREREPGALSFLDSLRLGTVAMRCQFRKIGMVI